MKLAEILLSILATYGPAAYAAAVELAHHPNPTKDDFLKLRASIDQQTYDDVIAQRRAERGLPPATTGGVA